jgi:hypothetical protein
MSKYQLYQRYIPLTSGFRYRLSFAARSVSGSDLSVAVLQHLSPFTNYGLQGYVADLTPSWQTFSVDFTASGFSGTVSDARLRFMFTPSSFPDQYFIDQVSLVRI